MVKPCPFLPHFERICEMLAQVLPCLAMPDSATALVHSMCRNAVTFWSWDICTGGAEPLRALRRSPAPPFARSHNLVHAHPAGLHDDTRFPAPLLVTDTCAICRNKLYEPSIEAQANPGLADDAGYSIAWGCCGHVFHLDCISRWLKTRSVCPLCNREWEFAKIEKIATYGNLD